MFFKEGKLLGLYQGMIKIARVDIIKLHQACIGGQLAQFIKSSFEKYPAEQRVNFDLDNLICFKGTFA